MRDVGGDRRLEARELAAVLDGERAAHVGDAGAVGSGECFGGGDQMVEGRSEEEVEDELPWQIIALLDAGITRDLLRSAAWREHKIRVAASGEELPTLPARSLEALLGGQTYGAGAPAALVEECWLYTAVAGCALRPAVGTSFNPHSTQVLSPPMLYSTPSQASQTVSADGVQPTSTPRPGPQVEHGRQGDLGAAGAPRL